MSREVEIKSEHVKFIQKVPKDWSNKRVKEELKDLMPIDRVKNVKNKNKMK